MNLNYITFYKKFGIRLIQQLLSPQFHDHILLQLPLESIYHYVDIEGLSTGPATDDPVLRYNKRIVPIACLTEFSSPVIGNPRRVSATLPQQAKDYLRHHRQFRMMRDLDSATRDKQAIVVYNYALLGKGYKYQQSLYTNYYRWFNIFHTAFTHIAQATEKSHRHHFLFVNAPTLLPSYQQLMHATEQVNQSTLKAFRDDSAYLLMHLWRWLIKNPKDTADNVFNLLPLDKLHLINFVFEEAGQWTVLNLGLLYGYREREPGEAEASLVYDFKAKLSGQQLAKRVLRFYMNVQQLKTITSKIEVGVDDANELSDDALVETQNPSADEDDSDDDETITTVNDVPDVKVDTKTVARNASTLLAPVKDEFQLMDDWSAEEIDQYFQLEDKTIDADLKQLDDIIVRVQAKSQEQVPKIEEVVLKVDDHTPEAPIMQQCDRLVQEGALSAAEHRRFEKLSTSYKTIIAPDGKSTLEQFKHIAPESLKIEKTTAMSAAPAVIDPTMLHSTLNEFDERYVSDVMHKDHVNMVLAVQNAGVAVTNYRVEKHANVLGAYEDHILKVTPISGIPSTLRFKLPVVNEDGTFVANGVRYRHRKLRGDVPLRKIAPDRVALTTYYGKTFVTRGRSASTDYGVWLKNQITAILLDKTQSLMSEPIVADVFDSELISPRAYSVLSGVLKGCKIDGYTLNFDHTEVQNLYPSQVKKLENKSGNLLLGVHDSGKLLVIDKQGMLYETEVNDLTQIPTLTPVKPIEEFFGLNIAQAPVEYVSVKVFGKDVPLAVVLGLEMGLRALVELLRVQPRIVPAGERAQLMPDEWSLAFSDETWIFSRSNRLASLILAGLSEYGKSLKSFSVYSFDKRGVYVNLLESNGLGTRYIREIDLMYQMFVDPISKEILVEMKEPTTFKGLLFRSAQMLLIDQHPDELDPAYMRLKGYERFPGAVYSELVQSLRQHNSKLSKANYQIELKPYAVWKRITEDPSKMLVQEINPIKAIKEVEAATFSGDGGRNKRSMTKNTRVYHPNDMGTISESTVDSSDVGINIYTSANPQFTSLRGMSKRFDMKTQGATALLSTSALISPFSDRDD